MLKKSKTRSAKIKSANVFHMGEANRMKRLPPYLFTVVDNLKREVRAKGVDVVDLSMGNPDLPPPPHVIQALKDALKVKDIHRYSKFDGPVETELRKAIANWYKGRFNVDLDPDREVLPLIGSKEGIAHLALAFLNNDDLALIPSPAYPVHFNGVIMAGGILYNIALREEDGYLPRLHQLPRETVRLSKLLMLSYPHNPTTATCDLGFFEDVVRWGRDKNLIIVHDNAYSDFVYDGKRSHSILEVRGSKKYCVEFHTFSKSYCMAGWRIGFVVGCPEVLASLGKAKSYCDFGLFRAIQTAAIAALNGPQDYVKDLVEAYRKRIEFFCGGLKKIGWPIDGPPRATFYVWTRIPMKFDAFTALDFAELCIREAGVAVAPGTGFGEAGEGYVRFALVEPEERLAVALDRLKKLLEIEG